MKDGLTCGCFGLFRWFVDIKKNDGACWLNFVHLTSKFGKSFCVFKHRETVPSKNPWKFVELNQVLTNDLQIFAGNLFKNLLCLITLNMSPWTYMVAYFDPVLHATSCCHKLSPGNQMWLNPPLKIVPYNVLFPSVCGQTVSSQSHYNVNSRILNV